MKNIFHIVIPMVAVTTMLIGLANGYGFERDVNLNDFLTSIACKESTTTFLLSTIPVIIDAFLDIIRSFGVKKYSPQYFGRLLIAFPCFLAALQFKIINQHPSILYITNDRSSSYMFTLLSLRTILIGCMLLVLCASNEEIFTFNQTILLNILSSVVTVFRFYSIGSKDYIAMIAATLACIVFISGVLLIVTWGFKMIKTYHHITLNYYTCILYFFTISLILLGAYSTIIKQWLQGQFLVDDSINLSSQNLTAMNYGLTIIAIVLNIVPGRIARYEAYILMKNNIKVKTEYVRFISHELRTPLNSVFLGLNLSISQIPEHSDNEENKERRDTLVEIASACSAALDILNQLLFFDKLDNGILELNKSKTRVTELIHDAIKMFTVQIREKNIDMKIQNNFIDFNILNQSNRSESFGLLKLSLSPRFMTAGSDKVKGRKQKNNYSIYSNEMIEIDKNKMIQVIRNIVSNAIKFTPEYGQISINLKFERIEYDTRSIFRVSNSTIDLTRKWIPLEHVALSISLSPIITTCWSCIIFICSFFIRYFQTTTNTTTTDSTITTTTTTTSTASNVLKDYSSMDGYRLLSVDSTDSLHTAINTTKSHSPPTNKKFSYSPSIRQMPSQDDRNYDSIGQTPRVYGDSVDGYLVIEITDTGAGISEENQQKLFKQIVQFKPEVLQKGEGSGLGMWISKGIVDLHGGKIDVHSEGEGRGSTFTVKLPMTRIYDETLMMSPKLMESIHVKDQTSLHALIATTMDNSNISKNTSDVALRNKSLPFSRRSSFQSIFNSLFSNRSSNKSISESVSTKAIETLIDPSLSTSSVSSVDDKEKDKTVSIPKTTTKTPPNIPFKKKGKKTVLVVDDSSMNRKMLCRLLKAHDYEYIQVNDGQEAVAYIERMMSQFKTTIHAFPSHTVQEDVRDTVSTIRSASPPAYSLDYELSTEGEIDSNLPYNHLKHTRQDLDTNANTTSTIMSVEESYPYIDSITMDFMMPNMDGPTATAEIRKLGYTGPIIGVTGNALQVDIDYFIEKGATQVLIKPLDASQFITAMSSMQPTMNT